MTATALVAPATITETAHGALAAGSKSFALAAKLLPGRVADDAAVVYAFCRRADDAIDRAAPGAVGAALFALRAEVDDVFSGRPADPLLAALQEVAQRTGLPREYLDELVEGFAMDVRGVTYATVRELLLYCHRVAGVVGLMMCHVMGVRSDEALLPAARLGIAMQLTNVCRDVAEDWQLGRLYLPRELFRPCVLPGGPFPVRHALCARVAVRDLLAEAGRYYAAADEGMRWLGFRQAFAVRTARHVYAAIGDRLQADGCDVLGGRTVVPFYRKLLAAGAAFVQTALDRRPPSPLRPPQRVLRFPDDVLPR